MRTLFVPTDRAVREGERNATRFVAADRLSRYSNFHLAVVLESESANSQRNILPHPCRERSGCRKAQNTADA